MGSQRSFVSVIAVVVTCLAPPAWAQDAHAVVVVLHDSAAVPPEVLESARTFVTAIFERAMVPVKWDANGGVGTACRPDARLPVDDRFCVQVLLRPRNSVSAPGQRRVMGVALAADNRRAVLSLYFDAVTDVARRYGAPLGQVLGLALAHEMGHVLLPPPSHSSSGIMQPSWEGDDIRHVLSGDATFTDAQVLAMRSRLAGRR
jgi:hypothetical protein